MPRRRLPGVLGRIVNARATVLVVDDDAVWRAVLEHWLSAQGMRGIGLGEGESVANAIETYSPGIVLLDVHLPNVNGLHVLELVRQRWPALPVIIMTAFGGRETEKLARRAGATGYLNKPFPMKELATYLSQATGPHGRRLNTEPR